MSPLRRLVALFGSSVVAVGTLAATPALNVQAGTAQNYIVLYSQSAVPADAAVNIAKAGGTLVYAYNQIGVVIARSDNASLRDNIDVANSANCLSGAPVPGLAAQDGNGHGTHTAGTIAAAANGFGVVGVAPNVKIAGIKAGNSAGFFFPEAVVCSFMWAGSHHFDVTNNSYFADPFLYNCRNDPVQRAIWKAEQRAIRYAMDEGVTVVAAAGNESEDLSHPSMDLTSPDFPPGSEVAREVTNACVVIPVEIPGVIGVTGVGS